MTYNRKEFYCDVCPFRSWYERSVKDGGNEPPSCDKRWCSSPQTQRETREDHAMTESLSLATKIAAGILVIALLFAPMLLTTDLGTLLGF